MKKKVITSLLVSMLVITAIISLVVVANGAPDKLEQIDGMVVVVGINGKTGYAKESDMDTDYSPESKIVPVYDKDCKTVIDQFKYGGVEADAPVAAVMYDIEKGIILLYIDEYITLDEFYERAKQDKLSQGYIDSVQDMAEDALKAAK